MALEGVDFTDRQGGDSRQCALTRLFLCLSFVQTVVKRRQSRGLEMENAAIFFRRHDHILPRARTDIYNGKFYLVAATKIVAELPADLNGPL